MKKNCNAFAYPLNSSGTELITPILIGPIVKLRKVIVKATPTINNIT